MIQSCIILLSSFDKQLQFLKTSKFQNTKFKNPNVTSREVIFRFSDSI